LQTLQLGHFFMMWCLFDLHDNYTSNLHHLFAGPESKESWNLCQSLAHTLPMYLIKLLMSEHPDLFMCQDLPGYNQPVPKSDVVLGSRSELFLSHKKYNWFQWEPHPHITFFVFISMAQLSWLGLSSLW
jgi:hypothetical protein